MAANQRHKSSGRKDQARPERRASSARESQVRHYTSEIGEQLSGYMERGASQVREMTREREITTVMVALATGFGVGLFVGAALASSRSRPRSWRERVAAEGLGRRVLERVESLIPETVAERFCR